MIFKFDAKRKRGVHSKKRLGMMAHIIENVWPSMGWRAFGRWVILKLRREAANPHKVALGVAVGVGISFLPLPGMGMLLSALGAWILGANIPAAIVGQWIGNPWTYALIFWGTLEFGRLFWPASRAVNLKSLIDNWSLEYLAQHWGFLLKNVLIPVSIGGVMLGLVFGALTYMLVHWELQRFWEKRKKMKKEWQK